MKWFFIGFGIALLSCVSMLYGYAVGLKHARILQFHRQGNTPKDELAYHDFNDVD